MLLVIKTITIFNYNTMFFGILIIIITSLDLQIGGAKYYITNSESKFFSLNDCKEG